MDEIIHIAIHVAQHSFLDTLYLVPFLYITYLAMEWLEHKCGARTQAAVQKAGVAGPVVGAVLGVVPQCGFSAAAATLWAGRVVTLGTLFTVFLSTSDEMLPIFIAGQVDIATIVRILGAKVLVGMVMGFVVDAFMRFVRHRSDEKLRIHELCARDRCLCGQGCETCTENPEAAYAHHDDCGHDCTHEHHAHDHSHDHGVGTLLKSALIHTAEVTLYIFIITCVLNAVLETVGEDALSQLLAVSPALSVLISALVGLIPNCAASVVIAQLYVDGVLGAGAMFAGLLVSAGVGLLVLLRTNRRAKQNLCIIGALYATGVIWGMLINATGFVF